MQEGSRRSFDMDLISPAADIQPVQGFDRRLGLAFGGAEGGEIMLAHQDLRGSMHRLGIQFGRDVPDLSGLQRWRTAAIEDADR